jgi:hypothetical protein
MFMSNYNGADIAITASRLRRAMDRAYYPIVDDQMVSYLYTFDQPYVFEPTSITVPVEYNDSGLAMGVPLTRVQAQVLNTVRNVRQDPQVMQDVHRAIAEGNDRGIVVVPTIPRVGPPTRFYFPRYGVFLTIVFFLFGFFMCPVESKFVCTSELMKGDAPTDSTDRDIKEPKTTQKGELGSFADVGDVTSAMTNTTIISPLHKEVNIETCDFDEAFTRSFVVADGEISSTTTKNTAIINLGFPYQLFLQPYIADRLTGFRYFKGGVKITIRINAARTMSGALVASWQPLQTYYANGSSSLTTIPTYTDCFQAFNNDASIVSVSSSGIFEFVFPFVSPWRALDLRSYGGAEIGNFQLMLLNPIQNVDGTEQNVAYTINAQFVDASVFMPCDLTVGGDLLQGYPRLLAPPRPKKYPIGYNKTNVKKQGKTDSRFVVTSHRRPVGRHYNSQREAYSKAAHHSVDDAYNAVDSVRATVETSPLVGAVTSVVSDVAGLVSDVATIGLGVGAMFGLDKPTTADTNAVVTSDPTFHMNSGDGISVIPKLALSVKNTISTDPTVAGKNNDEMMLCNIAQTPGLIGIWEVDDTFTATAIAGDGIDTAFQGQPSGKTYYCYRDHVMNWFAFWSGSLKFKIYITATLYHDVRLVFYWSDNASSSVDWESCLHKVIQVQGDTEFEFTVPYSRQNIMAQTGAAGTTTDYNPWGLFMSVIAWSESSTTAVVPIYVNVFKAAASDCQFSTPLDVQFTPTSCPRADFAHDFEPLHESIKGYKTQNFVSGEDIVTLRDLVHSFTPSDGGASTGSTQAYPLMYTSITTGGTAYYAGINMFALLYRFWRGSIRYHIQLKRSDPGNPGFCHLLTANITPGTSAPPTRGNAFSNNATRNAIIGEIPYCSIVPFEACNQTPFYADRGIYFNSNAGFYMFKAGGDDFSFHCLTNPPSGNYTIRDSSKYGVVKFATWDS